MASRLTVAVLGVFWAVMTVLLWWAEYGPMRFKGTPVAPEMVWQKVLTSPDSSSLAIIHRGERIGFCHVVATVAGVAGTGKVSPPPEGMVRHVGGYQLDATGSLHPPDSDLRLRFSIRLLLTPEHEWSALQVELVSRPTTIEASVEFEQGLLNLSVNNPELRFQRSLRLAEVGSAEALIQEILGPVATFIPDLSPFSLEAVSLPGLGLDLEWVAATDQFKFRQASVPAYRLSARLFEDSSVVLIISRAGEILRVELPDDMVWINDALTGN